MVQAGGEIFPFPGRSIPLYPGCPHTTLRFPPHSPAPPPPSLYLHRPPVQKVSSKSPFPFLHACAVMLEAKGRDLFFMIDVAQVKQDRLCHFRFQPHKIQRTELTPFCGKNDSIRISYSICQGSAPNDLGMVFTQSRFCVFHSLGIIQPQVKPAAFHQGLGDGDGRRFPDVIRFRFEGQAEQRDGPPLREAGHHFSGRPLLFAAHWRR